MRSVMRDVKWRWFFCYRGVNCIKWPILNIDIFWFIMCLMFVFVIIWKIVKRVVGCGHLGCSNGGYSRCGHYQVAVGMMVVGNNMILTSVFGVQCGGSGRCRMMYIIAWRLRNNYPSGGIGRCMVVHVVSLFPYNIFAANTDYYIYLIVFYVM